MSRLYKLARVPILSDFYDSSDYDFVAIGRRVVDVRDIIGMSDGRNEEYNADFTPINEEDRRWLYQKNLIDSGGTVQPIPLILMPNGKYTGNGDGSHRISALKVLNVESVEANVFKMVSKELNVEQQWEDYSKDMRAEFKKLQNEYNKLYKEINDIQDRSYEEYQEKNEEYYSKIETIQKELYTLGDKISKEELKFKNDILLNVAKYKKHAKSNKAYDWVKERAEHLIKVTDMKDGMCWGLAWNQWKKENPKWKSKEEKGKKIARLRKIKANNISNFFEMIWNDWKNIDSNEIDKIIQENPDCSYNNGAYRFISININKLLSKDKDIFEFEEIFEFIKNEIILNNGYDSASKNEEIARSYFEEEKSVESDFGVILYINVQNGLDLEKLSIKYKDDLIGLETNLHEEEKEILCKLNNDYEIVEICLNGKFEIETADEDNPFNFIKQDGNYIAEYY